MITISTVSVRAVLQSYENYISQGDTGLSVPYPGSRLRLSSKLLLVSKVLSVGIHVAMYTSF